MEEVSSNPDKLLAVQIFPVDSTQNQLKLEEEYTNVRNDVEEPFSNIQVNAGSQFTVKEEPLPSVDMEEVSSNPDKLLAVQIFPEDSTQNQLKLEEEYTNVRNDVEEPFSNIQVNAGSQFTVKEKPLPSVDMEEVSSNPDKLLAVQIFPVDSTQNQLKLQEEYTNVRNDVEEPFSNIQVNAGSQFTVREEPLPSADMEEVTSNPDKLLEVETFPEDSTQNQFKLEEEYTDVGNDVEVPLSTIQIKADSQFTVKEEPPSADMEEVTSNPDKLLEVATFPQNQLKFEEEYTYVRNDVGEPFSNIQVIAGSQFTVKEEPLPSADMEEVTSNLDKLLEVETFPGDSTQNQFKLEEECTNVGNDVEEPLSNIQVNVGSQFTVKEEPLLSADMKMVTSNPDKLLEVESFLGVSTNSQLKFEEDYSSSVGNDVGDLLSEIHVEPTKSDGSKMRNKKKSHSQLTGMQYSNKYNAETTSMIEDKTIHTQKKNLACREWDKQFKHKGAHMRTHNGKKFSCNLCEKQFIRRRNFNVHMRIHTGDKPFDCNECDKQFRQEGNLNAHMRIHTGDKPFTCNECDKQFRQKSNLNAHMRIHTGAKPFACNECIKQFRQKGNLKAHMRIHTGEKPFTCNECDKQFRHKCHFNDHMRTHPYECDKQLKHKSSLNAHMKTHASEKPFTCNECDKQFKHKSSCNVHIRKHNGKTLACNLCEKRFYRKTDLNSHMRIHTGEKPFACNECDKQFKQKGHLSAHMRIHTGEKPFACNECDKEFKQQGHLNTHMKTHTG